MTETLLDVESVIFRDDLYPRINTSAATVQKYAEDLSVLPPIEVNQNNELIDGWHRWTAHKKNEVAQIRAVVTKTASDADLLERAIRSNATHGLQLSQEDKRDMARKIYGITPEKDRQQKKKELEEILSVSERTVRMWLSNIDADAKESRNRRVFDLWLACHSHEEIADSEGIDKTAMTRQINDLVQSGNVADMHQTFKSGTDAEYRDFEPPLYNVWTFAKKSNEVSHFGNTEARIVDNLVYLYTQPFNVVLDPFAGGGATIDVCKKRLRRYYVSDRKPIVEREKEIRKHDITDGLPKPPQWQDVKLVYLDPPYWKQAEGEYSKDSSDLANMTLEEFTAVLSKLITDYSKKLKDAYIALVIQPTQWRAPDRQFTDHIADMLRSVKLPIKTRIQAPYSTEQCLPQMVNWAKENKELLVIGREVVVWRV